MLLNGSRLSVLNWACPFPTRITLAGTVPINQAALTWEATAPPEGWRVMINKWERLDNARTWALVAAFSLFLAAAGPR
jgi:hypothetical protein